MLLVLDLLIAPPTIAALASRLTQSSPDRESHPLRSVYHLAYPPSYTTFLNILGVANGQLFALVPHLSMHCIGFRTLYEQVE